ncbi:hydrogenase [Geotalea uraniireducens]|uniref:Hydrogenase n=1 Tax=Geotalea uraniireducens TaxID=351604 RepID=A0ABN6VNZ0_9BACT|nr:proton-conducting transporter membrane subunit [Geotalea uraniireducens]BDV41893.1 hydrogenase [Geotalea uraniireducens]
MNGAGELLGPGPLLVSASLLAAVSGLPLFLGLAPPRAGQRLATLMMLLAALTGIGGAAQAIGTGRSAAFTLSWGLPFGAAEFAVDPLTAFFALPVLFIAACCSLYALDYWSAADHPRTVRRLTLFFGLAVAAMLWVVMARNGVLFLIAWEIMALTIYFALTAEDAKPAVREAGTLYLITTHIGTLALFALFALLAGTHGSFLFPAPASLRLAGAPAAALFLAALVGFGIKSGLMPLHVWLPSAHANAPSHVSAIMSGVLLKIGIYGIVRVLSFFAVIPLWWGILLLVTGMISGVAGVAFAIGQHDLKRLLAYHSIENIGIIAIGLGVATIGLAAGSPTVAVLGIAGALLHVLNHATFKSLLFLGAGSVIHATGSREIDLLGGLLKRMPATAGLFFVGAVAICGLPPLNGFISELLIYLGIFREVSGGSGAAAAFTALAAPALALVGGLAVACFVKVCGVVFLGVARSPRAEQAHEAGWPMLAPMGLLALVCAVIGVAPVVVAPLLANVLGSWRPEVAGPAAELGGHAPLMALTVAALALLILVALLLLFFARKTRGSRPATSVTWGCGYLRPTPRMQYSASSFAEMLVGLFSGLLRPHGKTPVINGLAPAPARFASHVPETVLELLYLPLFAKANEKLAPIRKLQHGQLHLYILYTFITLVTLLIIGML